MKKDFREAVSESLPAHSIRYFINLLLIARENRHSASPAGNIKASEAVKREKKLPDRKISMISLQGWRDALITD